MIRPAALLLSVLLLVSMSKSAMAQSPVPLTTEEARKQFEAADAELNKVYQRCFLGADVQSQATLQKAQRLWVQCRDLTAGACQTGESSRHQIDDNYYFYARMVLTRSRIKELQDLFPPKGLTPQ